MAIKTLHITNSYHPASGGIRTFYSALLAAANRNRRHVRLVVPAAKTTVEEVGQFGPIYHIAAPQVPVIDTRYRWMLPHLYAWPWRSPLRRIFTEERPDLVEVCDKFWLLYLSGALRRGWIANPPAPVIVGLTCERLDENMRTFVSAGRAARFVCQHYIRRFYIPRFDFHIAASDYIGGELRGLLPDRRRDRLHVCPMGVDYDAFGGSRSTAAWSRRQTLLARLGGGQNASSQAVLLLYARPLSREKNLSLLPRVLAHLAADRQRRYYLVIAGDGPFGSELQADLQGAAPERFIFLGHCERQDLAALYHAADIFIHP